MKSSGSLAGTSDWEAARARGAWEDGPVSGVAVARGVGRCCVGLGLCSMPILKERDVNTTTSLVFV